MTTMTVIGRLGRDCELKYTDNGTVLTELSIAYNYGRKDGNGDRPTQWVRGTMWGKQAEALVSYLTKGAGVGVTLEDVHVREFDRNDGTRGHSLEGRVIKFEFLGGRNDAQQGGQQYQQPVQQPQGGNHPPQQQNRQQAQPQQAPNQAQQAPWPTDGGVGSMNDDIPF